eukprot:gene26791-4381_t
MASLVSSKVNLHHGSHCPPRWVATPLGHGSMLVPRLVSCAAESSSAAEPSKVEAADKEAVKNSPKKMMNLEDARLPKTGYFSIADPNAEVFSKAGEKFDPRVYSKAGEKFDPRVRGGRYKSDFIWNTNWQEALKREESLQKQYSDGNKNRDANTAAANDAAAARAGALTSSDSSAGGTVSFSRMSEMNNMDSDLSDVLTKLRQRDVEKAAAKLAAEEEARRNPPKPRKRIETQVGTLSPLRGSFQEKRLQRSSRSTKMLNTTVVSSRPEEVAEKLEEAERDKIKYEAMKVDFLTWTLALAAVGSVTTYSMYGQDISISYLIGAMGGFLYLRLLQKSVDGVGIAASTQPRLLIPVILALGFNRWNILFADKYDVHLSLLPILVSGS